MTFDPSLPPPPPPSKAGGYPITFEFDPPERIARWRPLVHWLLAIPHLAVLYVLGIVASVLTFVAWILGIFTGKIPGSILGVIGMYQRYNLRVSTYLLFLRAEYPPFAFDTTLADPGTDPRVRLDFAAETEGRNRLTIFFRIFMVIPQIFVLFFLAIGLYVVMFLAFFAVLILGRWPEGLRSYAVGFLRWSNRVSAYSNLMTDEYPPFSLT